MKAMNVVLHALINYQGREGCGGIVCRTTRSRRAKKEYKAPFIINLSGEMKIYDALFADGEKKSFIQGNGNGKQHPQLSLPFLCSTFSRCNNFQPIKNINLN
jgi:hypothetical protein